MSHKRRISEILFERFHIRMTYDVDRVLFKGRTAHQEAMVFRHRFLGKVLMLDGVTQLTDRDEFIYHEMMTHVPLFAHGNARRVLIIGGGDCGIAEEVLKHTTVQHVEQVEIDPLVVELSRKFFSNISGLVFDDRRFRLVVADGMDFIKTTDQRFDVIIVDSTDPIGPGKVLFTPTFYAACHKCLTARGILVTQNGVPFFQKRELLKAVRALDQTFASATFYLASVPTYVGGHLAMGFASKSHTLSALSGRTILRRYQNAGCFRTSYWTPEVHVASFVLPRFIAEILDEARN
jgi:spermidine synthase